MADNCLAGLQPVSNSSDSNKSRFPIFLQKGTVDEQNFDNKFNMYNEHFTFIKETKTVNLCISG